MSRTPATTSTATRLTVWALLVLVVGAGLGLASSGPDITTAADVQASGQVAAPGDMIVALHGKHGPIDELDGYVWSDDPDQQGSLLKLLPAYRWSSDASLFSNFRAGMFDLNPFQGFATMVASFTFGIAAWIWQGLLAVLAFGLTTNIADSAGGAINRGFNGMFASLNGAGVFAIVLVVGIFTVIKSIVKIRIGQALRTVLAVLIPLGLLYGMATVTSGNDNNPNAPGTPGWIAGRGVDMVDEIGVSLGSGFGLLDSAKVARPQAIEGIGPADTCTAYTHELYGQYDRLAAGKISLPFDGDVLSPGRAREAADRLARSETSGASRKLVSTVSLLWQRAFMSPWVTSQYGSPMGHKVACHQLEVQNGISPLEHMAIANRVADGRSPDHPDAYKSYPGDAGTTQASYLAWIACDGREESSLVEPFVGEGLEVGGQCATWMDAGTPPDGLRNNKMDVVAGATINSDAAEGNRAEAREFFQVYDSMVGANSGQRMLGGIAALATSGIYLWALGGIAVGSIIAQIGLVLLLILLPATLTMVALPSSRGQRNPLGMRMLKMTGGFFGAKLGLVVVMTLLMQSIVTMESLLNVTGRGVSSFVHMLIPLACLFLIRKLIKAAGFGNITGLTGALGLSTQAALSAEGGGMMTRRMRTAQADRLGGKELGIGKRKFSLDQADAFAKRQAHRAARAPLNTAKGAGMLGMNAAVAVDHVKNDGRGANWVDRKAELWGARKAGVLGRRDEDGNLVEQGIWQRAQTFNGIVGLGEQALSGGRSPVDAAAAEAARNTDPSVLATMQSMTGDEAARHNQRQQSLARKQYKRALKGGAGQDVDSVKESYAAAQLAGGKAQRQQLTSQLLGEDYIPGDVAQEKALIGKFKDEVGYSRGKLTLADSGAFVTPSGAAGVIPEGMTENATIQQARNPVHYLPPAIAQRRDGESENDYASRINLALVRKGLMDARTGATVDWAKLNGIDVDSEWGAAQALAAARGQDSALKDGALSISFSADELADIDRVVAVRKMSFVDSDEPEKRLRVAAELKAEVAQSGQARRSQVVSLSKDLKDVTDQLKRQAAAARSDDPAAVESARREMDALATQLSQLFEVRRDDNGKPVHLGPVVDALNGAFKDNKTVESYAIMLDQELDTGSKAKQVKMKDIDSVKHLEDLEHFFNDRLRELAVADPEQVSTIAQRIVGQVTKEAASLSNGATAAEKDWGKAEYQAGEFYADRRNQAEQLRKQSAGVPSAKVARSLNAAAKAFPSASPKPQLDR